MSLEQAEAAPVVGTSPSDLQGLFASELQAEYDGVAPEKPKPSATSATESEPAPVAPEPEPTTPEGVETEAAPEPDSEPDEAPATPTITAPPGMSEADRALFAQLPPEAQAWVTQREQQRTADYTRKTQEIAATSKAVQAERQALSGQLEQYNAFLSQITGQTIAPPDPALQQADPFAYQEKMADFVQAKYRQEQAQAEQAKVQAQRSQIENQQFSEFVQTESAKLVELMPEFKDPKAGPALKKAVADYALSTGIPATMLSRATAVEISILTKAMRFDAAQKAKASATAIPQAAPRSARPSPAKAPGSRSSGMAAAVQNITSLSRPDALAAAYLAELEAER